MSKRRHKDHRDRAASGHSEPGGIESDWSSDSIAGGGEAEGADPVVFGRNAVMSYLEQLSKEPSASRDVSKIYLSDSVNQDDRIGRLRALAARLGVPITVVPKFKLDSMAAKSSPLIHEERNRHQGVLAVLSPVQLIDFQDWLSGLKNERANPDSFAEYIIVALDGIEDPRNVGAIVRSAEAQGARAILIPEWRQAQVTELVAKTSAGALAYIPVVRVTNLVRCLESLKEEGFWVMGLSEKAKDPIYKIDLIRPLVIVVGSEGKGLRPLVEKTCDLLAAIPLSGRTNSLNASVALGIAVFEVRRQLAGRAPGS